MNYTIGRIRAKATGGELGYANTGTEQVQVQFKILEGPDEGRDITWWGYFTDKAADRTLKALALAGWDGEDLSVLNGLGNNEVLLVIADDTYNGETRQRVQWINPLQGPISKNKMSTADKAAFAAKMKGRTIKIQQETASQDDPDEQDDIPF